MLHRALRTAGCAAVLLLLVLPLAMAADSNFTVSDVHEDVTAASALAARDEAQAQGQQQAFDTLMSRLAPGRAPHVTPDQLTDLVASFAVANERTSAVRYVADYTFHFKPAAIRQLLQANGTAYVAPVRPVVVLPVFQSDGQTVLWDDPNPWRDAWSAHAAGTGALPVVVPEGGLADVSLIDAPKALSGDRAAIDTLSSRHENADVVVALAQLKDQPTRLQITTTRYAAGESAAPQTMNVIVTEHPNEPRSDLFTRAVGYTILRMAQSGPAAAAAAPPLDTGNAGTLNVAVPANSLADWVALRERLRRVTAIRAVRLISFGDAHIRIVIRYVGDEGQLRAALAGAGLDLVGSDPDWTMTVGAPGASPPPVESAPSADRGSDLGDLRKANVKP
jgi:hypothetical protein